MSDRQRPATAKKISTRRYNIFHGMSPAEVVAWARATIALPNLLVLDTETTGQREAEITEIGLLDGHGQTVLHTLVRARGPISPYVVEMTGISDAMLANAPSFAEVAPELAEVLAGSVVIIYNAAYDCRMIEREFERLGLLAPVYEPRCAMLAYATYRNVLDARGRALRWHSLGDACRYEGVHHASAHRVLGDCAATLGLVRRMAGLRVG